ncbi:MAG: transposase [Gammaproteobacteria bacterium]|nr:transposase [Gammaproteobacteria bacterium]
MSKRTKQEYNTEFREGTVNMVISAEKSTAQVARDLGIKGCTLYAWVDKTKSTNLQSPGKSNEKTSG